MSKYIFVTGGVCSSLGKGVAASSVASLLECSGLTVAMMKCDPYINVDAGNMSPYQHGEVYVTDDGAETDLDLGNYSRFTNVSLSKANSITTGKIYDEVIKNEREGRYNGRTVQVIPHITDEIKRRILTAGAQSKADVIIVEIGGTVGDIESIPFLEASRQLIRELGRTNAISMHLTLIPVITGGELKTKPTQHSVKSMQEIGIQPDILLCRCEVSLDEELRKKIALFCNVEKDAVFASIDVERTIYELPLLFHNQGLDKKILAKLGLGGRKTDLRQWEDFLAKLNSPKTHVTIALIGKKNYLDDCYKSVRESLFHAAVTAHNAELTIKKIDAEDLENGSDITAFFEHIDAIIVPGNYEQRGFLGLLSAVRYAREQKIPYLGIDLGMQLMAIETARTLLGKTDADSTEFIHNSSYPVISLPEEQNGLLADSIMKLGISEISLLPNSLVFSVYGAASVFERHRSKYAFDSRYTDDMQSHGLIISGAAVAGGQAEVFEWKNHPWGIGVQYHPEFVSKPTAPHPLFAAFIGAAIENSRA
ncbi:MAG: CTP synthase [Bacteroides sp.]|nr:CTP synthase [Prevotella sp.]MCM1407717.1 CTP synthase [Treponema brennaborense]MCM1469133.1 CTP synthase [Bacteroides sp.]